MSFDVNATIGFNKKNFHYLERYYFRDLAEECSHYGSRITTCCASADLVDNPRVAAAAVAFAFLTVGDCPALFLVLGGGGGDAPDALKLSADLPRRVSLGVVVGSSSLDLRDHRREAPLL